ncbi:MAG: flippase-like domain-containing protein [Cellvibrionaceae bacterium]|nr:flippase-like domain-containing protein [Cellvibrionaceae bacterium]
MGYGLLRASSQNLFDVPVLSLWKWLIGLCLLLALLVYVHLAMGWQVVFESFRHIPLQTAVAAFVLFVLSHLLRALRIYELIRAAIPCRYPAIAKLSALHQFANNLLPMRLGEVVFPWLLRRYFAASWQQGFARLIWLRLLDLAIMGSAAALLILLAERWRLLLVLIVLALVGTLGFWYLLVKRRYGRGLWQSWLQALQATAPAHWPLALRLLLWTLCAWLCKLAAIVMVVIAVTPLGLLSAFAGAVGGELSSILPVHGVAGAGSYEAAFLVAMTLVESLSVELVALAVTVHLFMFLSTALVTLALSPLRVAGRN